MSQSSKNVFLDTIKAYFFPSLVAIIGTLIWRDVSEMRSDIKMLLAQSNIDKTKIDNLERDVRQLEQAVFHKKMVAEADLPWFMKLYFKPEEEYEVKKQLKIS